MEVAIKKKRPKKKSDYEKYYKPHQRLLYVNEEDERLYTITLKLPDCPDIRDIDGYGLPIKKQIWKRPVYPPRLTTLEKACKTIDEVWEKLNLYREDYKEEWKFIEDQWDRRINGYWFFLNGVPTYIDGWHFTYIAWWKIDIGYPDYRSRDRKFFHFARYCYTTTEAFYPYKIVDRRTGTLIKYFNDELEVRKYLKGKDTDRVKVEIGEFFVDVGRRICLGFNYPKHRREGATYKADESLYMMITMLSNAHGGIQSLDGPSAGKAFAKAIVKPWKKLPFFFRPRYGGSTNPVGELNFDVPAIKIGGQGSITNIEVGLESMITWSNSANRSWYDGDKLHFLHNDEVGKTLLEDINARWDVQKKCLSLGNGVFIHGLAENTSTVGEMSEKGGEKFFRLCELSHFERRNKIGQTESGLFNLFIPAHDGLEGFIDIFGNSIIEDPPEDEVWRWSGAVRDSENQLIGAKRYLEEIRDEKLLREDESSIKEYEEEVRLHPTSFAECFITAGSGSGLNLKLIVKRIKDLTYEKGITKQGNFSWHNDLVDGKVVWTDDQIYGRWKISLELPEDQTNQRISTELKDEYGISKTVWRPLKPWKFTSGGDPYKFRKIEGRRLSKGGGSVFYERDVNIDPPNKPISEWETYRTICTYSYRPQSPDDYCEDMLMMCVYFGAMMFPEIDIPSIWDHFIRRGYDGYLKYQRMPDGRFRKTPGYNMRSNNQRIMQLHQFYISKFIQLERHIEVLKEAKNIKGIEDITNYDLFAAVGGSYLGSETDYSNYFDEEDGEDTGPDISDFFG